MLIIVDEMLDYIGSGLDGAQLSSLDEITRRSGVGPGTGPSHRHFLTKEALYLAVSIDQLEHLVAEAAVLAATDDPAAMFTLLSRMMANGAEKTAVNSPLTAADFDLRTAAPGVAEDLTGYVADLLDRARVASVARDDVTADEVSVRQESRRQGQGRPAGPRRPGSAQLLRAGSVSVVACRYFRASHRLDSSSRRSTGERWLRWRVRSTRRSRRSGSSICSIVEGQCGRRLRRPGCTRLPFSIATDMAVYFCDPGSPWQRGTNENTNGLLRQYFPRNSDLRAHDAAALRAVADELNDRPRKSLGWDTPAERLAALLEAS